MCYKKWLFQLIIILFIFVVSLFWNSYHYSYIVPIIGCTYKEKIIFLKPDKHIMNLDNDLKDYNNYNGYYHIDNITDCENSLNLIGNESKVLHLSENVNFDIRYDVLIGEMFEYRDDYDILPVILSGNDYYNIELNTIFDLSLKSEINDKIIDKKCIVVGKILRLDLPQYESLNLEELYDINKKLIIIPDIYRKELFTESNKYALNINELDEEITDTIEQYGIIIYDDYNAILMPDKYLISYRFYAIISIIVLIFMYSLYFRYKKYNFNKIINMKFIIDTFIIIASNILFIFIFKILKFDKYFIINNKILFYLYLSIFIYSILLYIIHFIIVKKRKYTEVKKHYEKL